MRISIGEDSEAVILKLEGRVTGPWVDELKRVWSSLSGLLGSKRLKIDLRGIIHMSDDGRQMLAEIRHSAGAEFIADTPMTKYFAEEACRASYQPKQEGF